MTRTRPGTAADLKVEASRAGDLFSELTGGIRGCLVRVEPWLQAGKYVRACPYHYCHVPAGQRVSLKRLITAAGLRWPAEESFEFGKDYSGLD